MFLFPFERAAEVLAHVARWTRTAPEDVTTSMRLMHFPPLPELPEFLRGRSVAVIDGAFAGGEEAGAEAVAALRALGPELDTWAMAPAVALSRLHMDPEQPMPSIGHAAFLGRSTRRRSTRSPPTSQPGAPLLFAELRQLGGALARVPEGAGAVGSLDGDYLYFTAGLGFRRRWPRRSRRPARRRSAALAGYGTGSRVPQLRRAPDRHVDVLQPRTTTRACAGCARSSTRTA